MRARTIHDRPGLRRLGSPSACPVSVNFELLDIPADPGIRAIVAYTAASGTDSIAALADLLAAETSKAEW